VLGKCVALQARGAGWKNARFAPFQTMGGSDMRAPIPNVPWKAAGGQGGDGFKGKAGGKKVEKLGLEGPAVGLARKNHFSPVSIFGSGKLRPYGENWGRHRGPKISGAGGGIVTLRRGGRYSVSCGWAKPLG